MTARTVLAVLLAVVAGSAAVLSFAALRDLALLCSFGALSALLPIVVDAGAAAGTLAWLVLAGRARSFGRALALVLLVASVAGNGLAHALTAYNLVPPWWGLVAVSAVAPAVLGAVTHLGTLARQGATGAAETAVGGPAEGVPRSWVPRWRARFFADPRRSGILSGPARYRLNRYRERVAGRARPVPVVGDRATSGRRGSRWPEPNDWRRSGTCTGPRPVECR